MSMKPLIERLMAKVEKQDDSGCWLWNGAANQKGYGLICSGGKLASTHRASFELHVGPIPNGMFVCHHCDVRNCVNPAHLFLGTMADCVKKGRFADAKGESNGNSKLTEGDVRAIRAMRQAIAAHYGICHTNVSQIISGKKNSWFLKDSCRVCWTVTASRGGATAPDDSGFYETMYDVEVVSEGDEPDTIMRFQITTQYDEPIKLEDVWFAIQERMRYLTVAMLTYHEEAKAE